MSVERWLTSTGSAARPLVEGRLASPRTDEQFSVDTVDTMGDAWKQADFSQYDVVFHVAGIAHVDPKPEMAPLYYKVNRDLAIEVAKWAQEKGVKQLTFGRACLRSAMLKGGFGIALA